MKIKSSPLPLKIAILTSALIGTGIVISNLNNIYQLGATRRMSPTGDIGIILIQNIILSICYLVMVFYLYKLVGGTSNREIISRKNLMSVRRILYVLFALLLTKVLFALILTNRVSGIRFSILFKLVTIVGSTWELWMATLVIYVLAVVFKRAVILKEEEALTI